MATEQEKLIVTLEANIKQYLSSIKKLEDVNKRMFRQLKQEIDRSSRQNESAMARMGANMGRGFQRGLRTMMAAAGIGGFIAAVQKSIRAVAELGDRAQDLGMRTSHLQAWNRMMIEAGGNVDAMARALSEVAEQGQDAGSKLAKLFGAQGLKVSGDVHRDMMTLLEILDRAQSAPQALRALEYVFGGRLGRQLAEPLRGGREAFGEAFRKNVKEGIALTEQQIRQARELEEAWNRLGLYFASRFSQIIIDTFGSWEGFESKAKAAIDVVVLAIQQLAEGLKNIGFIVRDLGELWNSSWLSDIFGKFDTAGFLRKMADQRALGGGGGGGTAVSPTATQQSRMKQAMAVLSAQFGPTTAAAIIGNLGHESALNPAARGDFGTAFGIAQWRRGRAWRGVGTFDQQLKNLIDELTSGPESGVIGAMRGKSLAEQTRIFMQMFERPSAKAQAGSIGNRIGWARAALGGGGGGGGPGITIPSEGGGEDFEETERIIQELSQAYRDRAAAVKDYVESLRAEREMQDAVKAGDTEKIARLKAEQEIRRLNVVQGSAEAQQITEATLAYERYTAAQEAAAQQAQQMQQVGQMLSGAISGFVQDLMNGVDAGEALSNMLKNLASQLMDMAIQGLFSNLFGGGGMGGGGLLGGMFGGAPAMAGAGGGMIGMGTGALRGAGAAGAVTIGGATINVAGNADTKTVAMMAKMIEVNNQQQRSAMQRDWGKMSQRYRSLRG